MVRPSEGSELKRLEKLYLNLQAVNQALNKENKSMHKIIIKLEREIEQLKSSKKN